VPYAKEQRTTWENTVYKDHLMYVVRHLCLGSNQPSPPFRSRTQVTKLTPDNFDATVKAAVDSDKTLFVRWIASEG